jgi:hypothetical protein
VNLQALGAAQLTQKMKKRRKEKEEKVKNCRSLDLGEGGSAKKGADLSPEIGLI